MFYSNYHSHCTFCDGRSSMEEFVKYAISKGIRKYGFSSHAPLPFHTAWNMIADDFEDYEKEFYRLKEKYKSKIELYLGLEIDFIYGCSDIRSDFFKDIKLDYSIGSIHYLDKLSENNYWTIDGPLDEFDAGLQKLYGGDIKAATLRFFEITTLMIEIGGFDIVGHMDKIIYHGRSYNDFDMKSDWYISAISKVLELIKSKGLVLEINTKSLEMYGITYPHQDFYQQIKELDIPVMVNSDCHYPDKIIAGFDVIYSELYKVGFRTVQQITSDGWKPFKFNETGLIEA